MDRSEDSRASGEQLAVTALTTWMLKATPFPMLVVEPNGRILYSNRLADTILEMRDGIESRLGMLRLQQPEDEVRLIGLLSRIDGAVDSQLPTIMRVDRPSGKRGFALTAFAAPTAEPAMPLWIILISDTNERMSMQPFWIESMFDVTKGEARVLALVAEGMSAEDIGSTLQIATATVRVHLRNVYRKLRINRQSDLVATILKSTLAMCACECANAALAQQAVPDAIDPPATAAGCSI